MKIIRVKDVVEVVYTIVDTDIGRFRVFPSTTAVQKFVTDNDAGHWEWIQIDSDEYRALIEYGVVS